MGYGDRYQRRLCFSLEDYLLGGVLSKGTGLVRSIGRTRSEIVSYAEVMCAELRGQQQQQPFSTTTTTTTR